MELRAHDRLGLVDHALVRPVVEVDKVLLPVILGERVHVDRVSVVLRGDVAAAGGEIERGDVVRAVAVLELHGLCTCGEREELVPETDAHDGTGVGLHELLEMVDGLLAMGRVAGAVGDEDTIEVMGNLVDGVVPGEARDGCTTRDQRAEDVLLHAAVDDCNVEVPG